VDNKNGRLEQKANALGLSKKLRKRLLEILGGTFRSHPFWFPSPWRGYGGIGH